MFLFILAIQLMKSGAQAVGPSIEGQFPFANGLSTMGTGWLGAYFVLSGSPVAATAISLFGAGTITKLEAFAMLSGSRLGASFIVLLTGFLYAMKHKDRPRGDSIGIGIQAMLMTAITYIPGMLIGYSIIRAGWLDGFNLHASGKLDAILGRLWGPIVDLAETHLPGWALFLAGLGVILVAFNLIDRVLPQVSSDATASKRAAWLKNPWTMFALGCLVAMLTLSVSVALTVLVPLAAKGYVKRDEAHPVHHGCQHHDARRHPGRRDAATHARRRTDRAGRSDRRDDRVAHHPGVLLPAREAHGDRARRLARGQQPAAGDLRGRACSSCRSRSCSRASSTAPVEVAPPRSDALTGCRRGYFRTRC